MIPLSQQLNAHTHAPAHMCAADQSLRCLKPHKVWVGWATSAETPEASSTSNLWDWARWTKGEHLSLTAKTERSRTPHTSQCDPSKIENSSRHLRQRDLSDRMCWAFAMAAFRTTPDFDMLIWWLQQVNIAARVRRFQGLLPHSRPLHPMLCSWDPLRDLRVTEQCGQSRRIPMRRVKRMDGS